MVPFKMVSRKLAFTLAAIGIVASSGFGQSAVLGVWKGKVTVDSDHVQGPNAEQIKAQLQRKRAELAKVSVTLRFKSDHTFVLKYGGVSATAGAHPLGGTWTLKQSLLTLYISNSQFKAPPQLAVISKDGRSFRLTQYGGALVTTFVRG